MERERGSQRAGCRIERASLIGVRVSRPTKRCVPQEAARGPKPAGLGLGLRRDTSGTQPPKYSPFPSKIVVRSLLPCELVPSSLSLLERVRKRAFPGRSVSIG